MSSCPTTLALIICAQLSKGVDEIIREKYQNGYIRYLMDVLKEGVKSDQLVPIISGQGCYSSKGSGNQNNIYRCIYRLLIEKIMEKQLLKDDGKALKHHKQESAADCSFKYESCKVCD